MYTYIRKFLKSICIHVLKCHFVKNKVKHLQHFVLSSAKILG